MKTTCEQCVNIGCEHRPVGLICGYYIGQNEQREQKDFRINHNDIIKEAAMFYGKNAQLTKICEECAELISAVHHYRDGRISEPKMVEEMADVSVMVDQMRLFFTSFDEIKGLKLERLKGKVAPHELP